MSLSQLSLVNSGSMGTRFVRLYNEAVAQLNQLITRYNQATLPDEQVALLQEIYRIQRTFHYAFNEKHISECQTYRQEINNYLFNEIKTEFKKLGIDSLYQAQQQDPDSPAEKSNPLAAIIANMSPAKISEMAKIVAKGEKMHAQELLALYKPVDPEYANYQDFLRTHEIVFLGGYNSKNFRVTSMNDGSSQVLKIEDRKTMSKTAALYLRQHSLQNVLPQIEAERVASYSSNEGATVIKTLIVQEYFAKGSMEDFIQTHPYSTDQESTALSLDIFSQMTKILINITHSDTCFFPDSKLSNWMLDDKNRVRISDDKSLCHAHRASEPNSPVTFTPDTFKAQKNKIVYTEYMFPPELLTINFKTIDIDKAHAYLLGKTIYQYLTNCSAYDLIDKDDGTTYNYKHAAFKTAVGKCLQALISNLVLPISRNRYSLQQAQDLLTVAKKLNTCAQLIEKINSYGVGSNDVALNDALNPIKQRLDNVRTIAEANQFITRLEIIHDTLEKGQPLIYDLVQLIQSYRNRAGFFTRGMHEKANKLEQAYAQVPVEKRAEIMAAKPGEPGYEVKKALAARRIRQQCYLEDGLIDETRAAPSYRLFKTKYPVVEVVEREPAHNDIPAFSL